MEVKIHLTRISKPTRNFRDGLVEDNGIRLKTFTRLPKEIIPRLSDDFYQAGYIPAGALVDSVTKYMFYNEYFSILEFRNNQDILLGYYVDVSTPLVKKDGEYFFDDLIVDLWIYPDMTFRELDWDEFYAADKADLLTSAQIEIVRKTTSRLRSEIQAGTFPSSYIK